MIVEFFAEIDRLPLASFNDSHQRMQSVDAEVVIILLHAVDVHYIAHVFAPFK